MKDRSVWINGSAAGLLMLVGLVIAMVTAFPHLPGDGSTIGAGLLLLSFSFIWIIATPILGVWLSQLSGDEVSPNDGWRIGVASGVFVIAAVLILGIVQWVSGSESILDVAFQYGMANFFVTYIGPAMVILFGAGFGGLFGSILFKKKAAK
jgi:hypothetical protein